VFEHKFCIAQTRQPRHTYCCVSALASIFSFWWVNCALLAAINLSEGDMYTNRMTSKGRQNSTICELQAKHHDGELDLITVDVYEFFGYVYQY
jgi:hypothetical protein